MKANAI